MKYIFAGVVIVAASTALSLITGCASAYDPNAGIIDECAALDSEGNPQDAPSGCNPSQDFGSDLPGMGENVSQFEENIVNNDNEKGGVEHDPNKLPKEAARQLAATAVQKSSSLSAPPTGSSAAKSVGASNAGQPKMYVVQTEGGTAGMGGSNLKSSGSAEESKSLEDDRLMMADAGAAGSFGDAEGAGGARANKPDNGGFGSLFGGAGGGAGGVAGAAGAPGVSFGGGGALGSPFDLEAYLARNGGRSLFDVVNDAYGRKAPGILQEQSRAVSSRPGASNGRLY